jgi:hypothetical protein
MVRYEVMQSQHGLPFGLFVSHLRFKDISYFWSSTFWTSKNALGSAYRKWRILGSLMLTGLIAITMGPSSALLMIPIMRSDWPGGGTKFWLVDNYDLLWPKSLGLESIGGLDCRHPTAEIFTQRNALNMSRCIWYSTPEIAQECQGLALQHCIMARDCDTWAISTSAMLALIADELIKLWGAAII